MIQYNWKHMDLVGETQGLVLVLAVIIWDILGKCYHCLFDQ